LREEVDILKHLSQASLTQSVDGRHPNVLAYIDSWEEDEALFIRTELCESGNLARFLWEYGRVFPRLDEARVWKIIVDLSNVCHAINLFFGSLSSEAVRLITFHHSCASFPFS
jgi:mitosis inhibitor protein kinase SWE1